MLVTVPTELLNRPKKLIAYTSRLNIHRAIRFTPARPFLCPRETIVSIPFSPSRQQVLVHHASCLENIAQHRQSRNGNLP
jgi:hypothetical protein